MKLKNFQIDVDKEVGEGGGGDILVYHSRLNVRLNVEWYGMAKNVSEGLCKSYLACVYRGAASEYPSRRGLASGGMRGPSS